MNAFTPLGTEGYICLYARVSSIDSICGEALFVSNEHNHDCQFSLAPYQRLSREGRNSNFDFRRFYPRVLRKSFKGIKSSRSLAEE